MFQDHLQQAAFSAIMMHDQRTLFAAQPSQLDLAKHDVPLPMPAVQRRVLVLPGQSSSTCQELEERLQELRQKQEETMLRFQRALGSELLGFRVGISERLAVCHSCVAHINVWMAMGKIQTHPVPRVSKGVKG